MLRESSDSSSQERPVIREHSDPLAREFIKALQVALPGKPEGFHQWAYLFSVGALTQIASDTRMLAPAGNPGDDHKHDWLRSCLVAALRDG
ncbi:hypothetical protein OG500_11285 [Kitasatospora sp. NBC_01250]|uniref:hypothetical protein n=1 Tax=unclassified Kitasatospora TaxID=2633591 RepID=UPI002E133FAA|nr:MULTISPECIES: hypothetical protein [unclassified Kitasatospora]WSJ66733.1 hypothetical protein OG294_11690 [Kitasatospora sp. NBC_01302]